jgi:pimeloyl-ACP methyl ester carboxylesterase
LFTNSTFAIVTRDADQIATQLHALLQQAGVTGPIIMTGHSMGGAIYSDYASHYPENPR